MSGLFRVDICSLQDREKLVADVVVLSEPMNESVAEVNQESDQLMIELYPRASGEPWMFPYEEFMAALRRAKERLAGRD